MDAFILPDRAALRALRDGTALVYQVEDRDLRNVTRSYALRSELRPAPALAATVNVGLPYLADQLGEGWLPIDQGIRWSGKHAVVYLPGPASAGQKLYLEGWYSDDEIRAGPIHIAAAVEHRREPLASIYANKAHEFHVVYDLAPELCGRPRIEVAFTVDRELGLAFGRFIVR